MREPWLREYYYDDNNFLNHPVAKRSGGRQRLKVKYAGALRRGGPTFHALSEKIRGCDADRRCGSGACPDCMAAAGRWFVERVRETFASGNCSLLTIVPSDPRLHPRTLAGFDLAVHRGAFLSNLCRANLNDLRLVGAMDFSFNFDAGTRSSFWSIHWHCIIEAAVAADVGERLKHYYGPSRLVDRPIQIKRITVTPERAFAYCYKNAFDAKHFSGAAYTPRVDFNHPNFPELAATLDQIGVRGRLVVRS